jgi:RNA polymerase sigma factor (sigma-70 family)
VLQQSFVNAWAALSAGADVRHLRGWLHQIVRNAAIAAARVPGEEALSETMIGEEGPQAEVERRLEVRETLRHVAGLPHYQRLALVGTAMEGRSREEIASDLGLTEGAVRGLVHRARATLRAAATAVTPLPLAVWAAGGGGRGGMPVADRIAELVAGAGSASLAGATIKAGGVVVASGAIATSVATDLPRVHPHHSRHHRAVVAERTIERPSTTPIAMPAPKRAEVHAAAPAPVPAPAVLPHTRPVRGEVRQDSGEERDHAERARPVAEPTGDAKDDETSTAVKASDDNEADATDGGDTPDDAPVSDDHSDDGTD